MSPLVTLSTIRRLAVLGHMRRHVIVWSLAGATFLLAVAALPLAATLFQPERVKRVIIGELSRRLGVDVTIARLSVDFFPRPKLAGSGLVVRLKGQPTLPPLATADEFSVVTGLLSAFRRQVRSLELHGLRINVPPSTGTNGDRAESGGTSVLIDRIVVRTGVLAFVQAEAGRPPLAFEIHQLEIGNLGAGRTMPFHATLKNPIPAGEAEIDGTFGPWRPDNPSATTVTGTYVLTEANLSSVNGLEGSVTSRGKVDGPLSAIAVRGEAEASRFSLALGGRPVPVTTTFQAIVDGTNGTTRLSRVDGRILETAFSAEGVVSHLSTGDGYAVDFAVDVPDGRIDDLLMLIVDSPEPLLLGDVSLRASFSLPPGATPVAARLQLDGQFGLAAQRFSDEALHNRFQELSRRGRGLRKDDPMERVMTSITGQFSLRNGIATVPKVAFKVPGASLALAGTYTLADGMLDFRGTMRTEARLSQAVGGIRSIFLKPFDPLFRRGDAGSVLPVRLSGRRDDPKISVRLVK